MTVLPPKKIVVLGMMANMPVAGVVWQTAHYMVGLRRLGYDAYYVECHGRTTTALMRHRDDDPAARAAEFIAAFMRRFDLGGDRWAFHAVHDDGRCYGLSAGQLTDLYSSAALVINLHGGTVPRPEHYATDRLVYLETDPVATQIELFQGRQETIDYLAPHCAFFTFGENYGLEGCGLPVSERFRFRPTRQPVVCDFWESGDVPAGEAFTTVGNWKQLWRDLEFQGQVYHWSKHHEYLKFLDLPRRTSQPFELALGSVGDDEKATLEGHGWRVRDAGAVSRDPFVYRDYVRRSRGEFTVAKDQNVRLRTGWFSDRSATYLAAGRPVVTQETGFSRVLPTGEGLFGFATAEEILDAVERINGDYARHSRAAAAVARECFGHEPVLRGLLAEMGV